MQLNRKCRGNVQATLAGLAASLFATGAARAAGVAGTPATQPTARIEAPRHGQGRAQTRAGLPAPPGPRPPRAWCLLPEMFKWLG